MPVICQAKDLDEKEKVGAEEHPPYHYLFFSADQKGITIVDYFA